MVHPRQSLEAPSVNHARTALLVLSAACLASIASAGENVRAAAAASITDARCRSHVEFLASDLLEGRATPSRGLDVAATYIQTTFSRLGLKPGGTDGTWFQGFPVPLEVRLKESSLAAAGHKYEYGKDYMPLPFTGQGTVKGGLVFAGYGITAEDEGYDDYATIDVKDKVVLVLRHEPLEKKATNAFAGERHSRYAYYQTKLANAARRGAAALLVVTDPLNHEDTAVEGSWPQQGGAGEGEGEGGGGRRGRAPRIPAFHISGDAAKALLGGRDLKALQNEIDEGFKAKSYAVEGVEVALSVATEQVNGEGRNVIGVLRGTDPTVADECVVIGAHYDHVGMQSEKGPTFYGQIGEAVNGDRIHNGADDNASGTAALLEVARAFTESGPTRRTVVFIAFAGEELGLVGSRWYVRHPLIANEKTIAMLNLDMVGRNDPGEVEIGGQASAGLRSALDHANASVGMKLKPSADKRTDGSSDHASFERVNVPVIFFFAGFHPDYHRVTDHASLIVGEKIARIGRLAFLTAGIMADETSGWF
jgi:hypothetical protein